MIEKLKSLLGFGRGVDFMELIVQGCIILDVRSRGEYATGHIKGSLNIPVDQLHNNLEKLRNRETPVITCCASGLRSAAAKRILETNGFSKIHDGGSWIRLQREIIRSL